MSSINPFTKLTEVAVAIHKELSSSPQAIPNYYESLLDEPVIDQSQRLAAATINALSPYPELADLINKDPELFSISDRDGDLGPMIITPTGGMRTDASNIIKSIYASAAIQAYYFNIPFDVGNYIRLVIEGFDELRRAVRGEPVRMYHINGVAMLSLPKGKQVTTPWGVLRTAPESNSFSRRIFFGSPATTATLTSTILAPVIFDRSPEPKISLEPSKYIKESTSYLFPLSCALASNSTDDPVVPLITWSTSIFPFFHNFGVSSPLLPTTFRPTADISQSAESIEEWSKIVDKLHNPSIDVAARRLVSAVSHRMDKGDSLIDAVMCWENLLGTSSEVSFRVTAAMSKLLEPTASARRPLRKQLSSIYGIRSKLVHGTPVPQQELEQAAKDAISFSARALRAMYQRGGEWISLTSLERADILLLETP